MKTPRYDLASGRQSQLWSNRLWILAALLGAASIVHTIGVVHDNRAWRDAVHGVARATALRHAERINERLQLYAMETFSPLTRRKEESASADAELEALARVQQTGEACKCRNVLPVMEFFRVEPGSSEVFRTPSGGAYSKTNALDNATIADIAKAEAARAPDSREPPVRLSLGANLKDNAVATLVHRDSAGAAVAVYGLVANSRLLLHSLFGQSGLQFAMNDSAAGAFRVDTLSLQVGRTDSTPLFGKLDPDKPYRAKVFLHGPMDGLGVSVAITSSDAGFSRSSLTTVKLWAAGFFLLCTLLVIVIAIMTSRREMFLARARSDFIAGTSHDLRMPLAQILLAGETLNLQPGVGEIERANLTKSILRETRRLIGMVENVLLYSRSGAVEIKPSLQKLSVSELFEDVCEAVQLAADENGQTIRVGAASGCAVKADRQLLRQAMVNLVDNAMKYGKPKQVVKLSALQHTPTLVHLRVDDEGPGIPEAQRTRVFEPYERLTRDQASERAGSGLGLAVVYHIARVCGGRVWIESAPGGGARIVIELQSA